MPMSFEAKKKSSPLYHGLQQEIWVPTEAQLSVFQERHEVFFDYCDLIDIEERRRGRLPLVFANNAVEYDREVLVRKLFIPQQAMGDGRVRTRLQFSIVEVAIRERKNLRVRAEMLHQLRNPV